MKSRQKAQYLIVFIVLVLLMIGLGGITRLTRSGLSIVEWKPVIGMIPPLNEQQWQEQFDLYRASPEFQKVNSHFELADYKKIFLWEYLHRVFGRIIFLFTVIFGFWLWRKKKIEGGIVLTLATLVALQGLVGWLMVKSGLKLMPHVSPYLLALHYFMALFVLVVAYFHLSKMRSLIEVQAGPGSVFLWRLLGTALGFQVFYGCLTSGLKAGFAFNTYPLMGTKFLPMAAFSLSPPWINFFENPILVQWIHRWLGMTVFVLVLLVFQVLANPSIRGQRGPFLHLLGITSSQVLLGILTLILGVPTLLATVHQVMAALIVLGYLNISFRWKPVADNVRLRCGFGPWAFALDKKLKLKGKRC